MTERPPAAEPQIKRLLRYGSVYTLGTLAQMASAAAVIPVITRLVGAEQFGVATLALAISVVIGPICTLGIPAAISRQHFDDDVDRATAEARARQLIVTTGLTGAVGTALVLASLPLWADAVPGGQPIPLALGILLIAPTAVAGACSLLLQAQERPAPYLFVALLSSAGAQLAGVAGIALFDADATSYLTGYVVANLLAAIAGVWLARVLPSRLADRRTLRSALALGAPTLPHLMGIYVLALGDRILIDGYLGADAVGRYQVAYAFGALPMAVLGAMQTAWVPITFRSSPAERWPALADAAVTVSRLGAILVGAIAIVGPAALPILAPASYDPDGLAPVTAVIACAGIPWSIYLPLSQVMFWERRTTALLWVTPLAAAVNLALVALLLPPMGLAGAGLATAVAIGLQAYLVYRVVRRLASVPWHWASMAVSGALGLSLTGIALIAPTQGPGLVLRMLIAVALGGLALRTLLRAFKNTASPTLSA